MTNNNNNNKFSQGLPPSVQGSGSSWSNIMTEAKHSYETLVLIYQLTRRRISEK